MQVWIGRDGERFGPYPDDEIRARLRDGSFRPDELGWYEGMADWRPLGELFPDDRPPPGTVPPEAPPPPPFMGIHDAVIEPEYAGFWLRFGAWVIDYIILMVPLTIIAMTMGLGALMAQVLDQMKTNQAAAMETYAAGLLPFAYLAVCLGFVYYTLFEASKWQATPGKLAVGIRVTDIEGKRISLGRSAGRNAVRLTNALRIPVPLPLIFFVVAAFTQKKQGVHDLLASTYVVLGRADKVQPIAPTTNAGGRFDA